MNEIVSKKYVKAIFNDTNLDLNLFIANLSETAVAFSIDKFRNIINLPTLKTAQKIEFILSLVNNPSSEFKNFIKLLGANKRLELVPTILSEIKMTQSLKQNIYSGSVYASVALDKEQLSVLEDKFSNRFDAKVRLDGEVNGYNGVKIELDELGVEVNFSMDRLKTQISEYILKAI
ncbi:F0F1 ATP synthase subunit delta [Campylobacter sp. faydin G-140]|uniref:F0F1 ATP synthase subunit delta n=1 Tax=Campylobacter anatolicus TaxID=2829105 RepID=UPI001B9AD574|nr:F0F1 ATP synthase subunit delta [Campylobacter anatolicus]MBR8465030.1 F0F1 ATP synthase subunit delta [Campylobacter anatolicus]